MMIYNAAVFDFDGTIAYTSKDVWSSVEYAAKCVGSIVPQAVRCDDSNLGLGTFELFNKLQPVPPISDYDKFDKEITVHYRTVSMYHDTCLYHGIEDFIQMLISRSIPRYIVTLKPKEPLERILKIKNWGHMFDGWYTPDYFDGCICTKEELLRILLDTKLQNYRCVYIGDSYTDVIAARKNHMDSIGVTYGDGDTDKLVNQKPAYIFNNISEAVSLFL